LIDDRPVDLGRGLPLFGRQRVHQIGQFGLALAGLLQALGQRDGGVGQPSSTASAASRTLA
jgi:hypothetical protein